MASTEELSYAYLDAHPAEAARVLERLTTTDCAAFFAATPTRLAVPVLRQMLPLIAARCLERLDDETASGLLRGVGPQAGAAMLRHVPEARRAPLLGQLATTAAIAFRLLLSYSADTVGGWMDPHALAVPAEATVREALEHVRRADAKTAGELYVLDNDQRLGGAVALPELLRADTDHRLGGIARPAPHALPARAPLTAVRNHRGWEEHRALPVVERGERFVGVLSHGVMMRALARDTGRQGTPAPEAFVGLARTYWRGVSGVIEAAVGVIPVVAGQTQPDRTDGDRAG